ncbi:MAG: hypothetical protein K2F59_02685, partial [Eubacteriales bacterium]|nr:hypothetical protein [Eubacteriales bacterium]
LIMNFFRKIFQDKKNYYNLLIILFAGILILYFSKSFNSSNVPKKEQIENVNEITIADNSYEANLEKRLEQTLSKIYGVGQVDVLITLENGKEIVTKDEGYKENSTTTEQATNGDKREILSNKEEKTTVKISGDDPLIIKEISPKISGVLIVAEGGGNIEVKNNLINATKALLGVEIHKIEVLKMK